MSGIAGNDPERVCNTSRSEREVSRQQRMRESGALFRVAQRGDLKRWQQLQQHLSLFRNRGPKVECVEIFLLQSGRKNAKPLKAAALLLKCASKGDVKPDQTSVEKKHPDLFKEFKDSLTSSLP